MVGEEGGGGGGGEGGKSHRIQIRLRTTGMNQHIRDHNVYTRRAKNVTWSHCKKKAMLEFTR